MTGKRRINGNRPAGGDTDGNMLRTMEKCVWPRYLGLLQVAVHGLGDIGSVDGVVVGVLGVVVLLHHA